MARASCRPRALSSVAIAALAACATPAAPPQVWRLPALEREAGPPGAGETVRATLLRDDDLATVRMVQVAGPLPLHLHARIQEIVVLLRGEGVLTLGAGPGSMETADHPMGPGDAAAIPRGTLHAFRPTSTGGALALSLYLPPDDGSDRRPAPAAVPANPAPAGR